MYCVNTCFLIDGKFLGYYITNMDNKRWLMPYKKPGV